MQRNTILFSESDDAGQTWNTPVVITEQQGDCIDDDGTAEGAVPAYGIKNARYVGWALNNMIYFSRSLDGKTWEEFKVAHQKDGWTQNYAGFNRANGMPVTVVDHCKKSDFLWPNLCVLGEIKMRRTEVEIWISSSDNAGANWSHLKKVSPNGGHADQFLPWVTVDPTSSYMLYTMTEGEQKRITKQTPI